MKLGVLFSGGKDSTYALMKAMEKDDVVCLISILSKNKESYMFHTPNVEITDLQAEAIGLPIIQMVTEGKKEEELKDLEAAIKKAKEKFKIAGIVTGAVESVYQAERIQRICNNLDIFCFNPIWKRNQKDLMKDIVKNNFKVIISGIFAYPLDESWLGREIDIRAVRELVSMQKKYGLSPSGEGGEIETTVLDAPFFKKRIENLGIREGSEGQLRDFCDKESAAGGKMILILDMNYKKGSLGFYETVLPLVSIVKGMDVYEIKHYKQIGKEGLGRYDKVILSGNTLKDVRFLDNIKSFEWMRDCSVPMLGICAGMQVMGLTFGSELVKCQEIGMGEVEIVKDNILFSSKFKAYELHNFAIRPSEDLEVLAKSNNCIQAIKHKEKNIYGVLFHPEVRNKEIVEKFVQYPFR